MMQTSAHPELKVLKFIELLESTNSKFIPIVDKVYEETKSLLNNRIQTIFPLYTLHNTDHSFRIIEYMYRLVEKPAALSELEITMLICSALLHDIGMATSQDDIDAIKSDNFPFCEIKFSSMKKFIGGDENLALQEYIRRIHADLSGKFVREKLSDILIIPSLTNLSFANDVALICESHTKDFDWIKTNLRTHDVKGDFAFNAQFISAILRLADILDIDGNRTPYRLYQIIKPIEKSDTEWQQHYTISNNEKIITEKLTGQKKIVFHGEVRNPKIHRKILTYIDWVKAELICAVSLAAGMDKKYNLFYDVNPIINIRPVGYTFSDHKMTLQFNAISSLLMGDKIYGRSEFGLRELIQNSIDACRVREEAEQLAYEYGAEKYTPKIKLILDPGKKTVTLKDNGTGMTLDVIKKHFLNIGVSYYRSDDFLLKDLKYKPIGNFGIGFLSCFMLSERVTVNTRYYKESNKISIELEKGSEWTPLTMAEDVTFEGTEVIMDYGNFISVFGNISENVQRFLKANFITEGIEIKLIDRTGDGVTHEIVNSIDMELGADSKALKINFKDFLHDFEGYAIIKQTDEPVLSLKNLSFQDHVYYYNGSEVMEVQELSNLNIADYITDNTFRYIDIPLVENHLSFDYRTGLDYFDEIDDVIDRFSDNLKWISILIPKEYHGELYDTNIDKRDTILDGFKFETLVQFGHSISCPTKIFIEEISLFEGIKNKLYIPCHISSDGNRFDYDLFGERSENQELFLRDVRISGFTFYRSTRTTLFQINKLKLNLKSRDFIPDISRNQFDPETLREINYIINRTIHRAALKLLNLEKPAQDSLQKFIDTFYGEKTKYEIS